MPWLKLLHISAVIVWCGALLYLPAALAAGGGERRPPALGESGGGVLRNLFTLVATPAALVAIASGTAIFVLQGPLALWLLAKLVAVGLLVLAHAASGLLILRVERRQAQHLTVFTAALATALVLWLGTIAWLVLQKPF